MRIVITGGAGFIGSHLVDRLVEEGHEIAVIDNLYRGKMDNIASHIDSKRITFHEADIRDYDTIRNLFKNRQVVFHLAAQSNVMGAVEDMDYAFQTNVYGTFNVLKAARAERIKRLIFTSSREAYGEARYLPVDEDHALASKNTYGASKAAGETFCRVFQNMQAYEVVILRLANVYGERDFDRVIPIFVNNALHHDDIHIYGGQQVIDFVSVHIVMEALVHSIDLPREHPGPINIGSGKGTTLFDLADRIVHLTNGKSRVIIDPPREAEVVKFTADVSRFCELFQISLPEDPLYYLPEMLRKIKLGKNTKI